MKRFLPLIISMLLFTGCDDDELSPDCSTVLCAYNPISVNIKYVDKNTNAPLFSTNTAYKLNDLKVAQSANSAYIPELKFDPNDNSVVVVTHIGWGETLTLGNLPADKITMTSRRLGNECCSGFEITSIKINNETICAPCNDLTTRVVIIKK